MAPRIGEREHGHIVCERASTIRWERTWGVVIEFFVWSPDRAYCFVENVGVGKCRLYVTNKLPAGGEATPEAFNALPWVLASEGEDARVQWEWTLTHEAD